jgi:rRNA maturation endonuclease Nob1
MKKRISVIPYAIACGTCGTIYNVTAEADLVLSINFCGECGDKKKEKDSKPKEPKPSGKKD